MTILACADLMTASRLETSVPTIVTCRNDAAVFAGIDEGERVVIVDLQGFPQLGRAIRDKWGSTVVIIAFAPHVQEDALAKARDYADIVRPRGGIIKGIERILNEARQIADTQGSDGT